MMSHQRITVRRRLVVSLKQCAAHSHDARNCQGTKSAELLMSHVTVHRTVSEITNLLWFTSLIHDNILKI